MRPRMRPREAILRDDTIRLFGPEPRPGDRLSLRAFSIPAARNTTLPLTPGSLATGLVLLSTLPNIERHSCATQIAGVDRALRTRLHGARSATSRRTSSVTGVFLAAEIPYDQMAVPDISAFIARVERRRTRRMR